MIYVVCDISHSHYNQIVQLYVDVKRIFILYMFECVNVSNLRYTLSWKKKLETKLISDVICIFVTIT